MQLAASAQSYGVTKSHAIAFRQEAPVTRLGKTVPNFDFAEASIAVTLLGLPGTKQSPALERALEPKPQTELNL